MVSQICINIKTLKGFQKHEEKSINPGLLNTKALPYSKKPLKLELLKGLVVYRGTKTFFCSSAFPISLHQCIGLEDSLNPFLYYLICY